jgi:hypothetical protein
MCYSKIKLFLLNPPSHDAKSGCKGTNIQANQQILSVFSCSIGEKVVLLQQIRVSKETNKEYD